MANIVRATILVDTREQDPWTFRGRPVWLRRKTLRSGDYSVLGHSAGGIVIERKSVADLFGTMLYGGRRFEAEMRRLSAFGAAYLVVEGSADRVRMGTRYSGVNGGRLLESVYRLCAAHGVHPFFAGGRREAEDHAYHLLTAFRHTGKGR